jgi:DNA polymerase V
VQVFSSNYELYGDISHRVMSTLTRLCPDVEIYSIDEAFLVLDEEDNTQFCTHVRQTVKRWTGMPVSIGIAPTKTLAKIANHLSKQGNGVFDLCDRQVQDEILAEFPVAKIWGVGSRISRRLNLLKIHTARELRDADAKQLRAQFSVVMEKTINELRGISCMALEAVQPRKQIISSRSFGTTTNRLAHIQEALSHYAATASYKLRGQHSLTPAVCVFLQTGFNQENVRTIQYSRAFAFALPTDDTGIIIAAAKKCLQTIYRQQVSYSKVGIMLLDLVPDTILQYDMLAVPAAKKQLLLQTLDSINSKWGRNTLCYAAEGIGRPWLIKCDRRSPRYTTRWSEIIKIRC